MVEYFMHKKKGTLYPRPLDQDQAVAVASNTNIVRFPADKAKVRIEATKEMIRNVEAVLSPEQQTAHKNTVAEMQADAREIVRLEQTLESLHERPLPESPEDDDGSQGNKTPQQLETERMAELLDADPHIQQIKAMKKPKDVARYIAREFGETVDPDKVPLNELRDMALNMRAKRIIGGEDM
jgi:hypothetical protein